ncbi:response regulator [Kovacikia minuta CCNUW1]|uniref:hybrid sensor histidine kinase/response regulator n=1 Tax=Kovacikia minuta TaxID=2931930 RepID=UPI001CCDEF88|nr:GAF domain-containing hybrid sensor histidine kinase/response regulator [Kovacikia minuta]UBF28027.1 response regulator [Kovacikia minuta CCNUW1]
MSIDQTSRLCRILPAPVFDQLGSLLRQIAEGTEANPLVLAETALPVGKRLNNQIERFVAVVSSQFSGLLVAEAAALDGESPLSSHQGNKTLSTDRSADPSAQPVLYQVGLSFSPAAIAVFLNQISQLLPTDSPLLLSLRQASQQLQPNHAALQSEFTLRLVEILTATPPLRATDASCDLRVEAALRQQVEQERSLNQVTTQIRQSLDLPLILQTAVQEAQKLLQSDRAVIYEFEGSLAANGRPPGATTETLPPRPLASSRRPPLSPSSPHLALGCVSYEALATDALPSVLHLAEEAYCFSEVTDYRIKYHKGFILAVNDTETAYSHSSCLLKLLRQAKVRAKLVVPIVVREELWGLLVAHQCTEPRHWEDHEKVFLQRIAEHLAIAIYQARLYSQLQQQKQMLEQRVVERTQELGDALVAAQAASRAKTEFLAAMSHELRTPLTCVIGMAETLLRAMVHKPDTYSLDPQKQQDYLKIIKRSGEHLLELINDILDVSQVEAGKTILNVSKFSLAQLAHQSLQMLREKAQSNGVEFNLDLRFAPEGTGAKSFQEDLFTADRRRVSQILLNLLSNAIKFTPAGGRVTLRVWLENNFAVIQVQDTGIGIPKSQYPLLFQKFQQLDGTYHRRYEGTGLGLALTKQLVELHGGKIDVDSTVGKGSTFTVWLPAQPLLENSRGLKAFHPVASALSKVEADRPIQVDYPLSFGGRIVLIEDHEESAMLICDLLTAAGCQVIWMVDGSTAIKQIELLQPLLVITDIQLPGIDGFEIMQFLRQHPATQNTKILALTARALPEDKQRCLEAGANDYLAKPIQPYQLLDKVAALVSVEE